MELTLTIVDFIASIVGITTGIMYLLSKTLKRNMVLSAVQATCFLIYASVHSLRGEWSVAAFEALLFILMAIIHEQYKKEYNSKAKPPKEL